MLGHQGHPGCGTLSPAGDSRGKGGLLFPQGILAQDEKGRRAGLGSGVGPLGPLDEEPLDWPCGRQFLWAATPSQALP